MSETKFKSNSELEKTNIDDLCAYALEMFDVKIDREKMKKKNEIIGYIKALTDGAKEVIKTDKLPAKDIPDDVRGFSGKKVRIIFHNQDGPTGRNDVRLSLNGYAISVKREKEVEIPEEFIEGVLKGAVETKYEPSLDNGEIVVNQFDNRRLQYSILGESKAA